MIDPKDIELVRESLDMARQAGAEKARSTLCRSEEDLVATLNGEVDRVTHCVDSSLSFALFADGRFGSFSTHRSKEVIKLITHSFGVHPQSDLTAASSTEFCVVLLADAREIFSQPVGTILTDINFAFGF